MKDESVYDEEIIEIETRPFDPSEALLRQKWVESVAGQSELMDALARQLITIELAIPGLYAAVLKLVAGEDGTMETGGWFYLTFGCWAAALLCSLIALVPRAWRVDPSILQNDPSKKIGVYGLEDFFKKSAQYKRKWIIASIATFFIGIIAALQLLF